MMRRKSWITVLLLPILSLTQAKDLNCDNFNEFVTDKWIAQTQSPKLKIYIFNFTNPDEFLQGAKPKLDELGPYVFQEDWVKDNIKWKNDDKSIEYNQLRTYKFLPKESTGRLRDTVTVPNIPMMSALNAMKDGSPLVRRAVGSVLDVLDQKTFITQPVRKLLFGYANPLLKLGRDILPPEKRWPHPTFGLFVGKNATADGTIEALTGLDNSGYLGQIIAVNGNSKLSWWSGQCNDIKGSDGFVYPPNLTKNDKVHIYNRDLCRSIPLEFEKEIVDGNGIPGFRFVPPSNVFGTPNENPENACFCTNHNGVCNTPSGVFNVSICQFGSPTFLSWPHFFQADPILLDAVEGLNPNKDKHQFFVDVQPKLGTGLSGKIRSQVNIQMSKIDGVKQAKGLRDILLPIIWFSDDLDQITDQDMVERIKAKL